jgi:hypothetical protein
MESLELLGMAAFLETNVSKLSARPGKKILRPPCPASTRHRWFCTGKYSRRAAAISREKLVRNQALVPAGVISDAEYAQLQLKQELDEADIVVRSRAAELANAQLSQKRIVTPVDGIVYKMDLRPGESFTPGDKDRIIIGSPALELVCDLETLWIGRIDTLREFDVFNAETGEAVGRARFASASRYLRPKQVQTEYPRERQSGTYQEVIMLFTPSKPGLPIGLPVMVRPSNR